MPCRETSRRSSRPSVQQVEISLGNGPLDLDSRQRLWTSDVCPRSSATRSTLRDNPARSSRRAGLDSGIESFADLEGQRVQQPDAERCDPRPRTFVLGHRRPGIDPDSIEGRASSRLRPPSSSFKRRSGRTPQKLWSRSLPPLVGMGQTFQSEIRSPAIGPAARDELSGSPTGEWARKTTPRARLRVRPLRWSRPQAFIESNEEDARNDSAGIHRHAPTPVAAGVSLPTFRSRSPKPMDLSRWVDVLVLARSVSKGEIDVNDLVLGS